MTNTELTTENNAQHSTGPRTEEGKAISCMNNFKHGLCGIFSVLPSESQLEFQALLTALRLEHHPATATENILVDKMAQHYWISQRAQLMQDLSMDDGRCSLDQERSFALYMRYQTTNERAFSKCLNDLLKLRAERRKQEIGFESQKQKEAAEVRKTEVHGAHIRLATASAARQEVITESKKRSMRVEIVEAA